MSALVAPIHPYLGEVAYQDELNQRYLLAIQERDFPRALRFLSQGANINIRGLNNECALSWATRMDYTAIAMLLLDNGASLDPQDKDGYTTLMYACRAGNIDMARRLIDLGADVTLENRLGEKALDMALENGQPALVELFEKPLKRLLRRIPNAAMEGIAARARASDAAQDTDPHGDTTLTWAARTGQVHIVRTLVDAGADTEIRNRDGQTPRDIARAGGQKAILEILEKAGASRH